MTWLHETGSLAFVHIPKCGGTLVTISHCRLEKYYKNKGTADKIADLFKADFELFNYSKEIQ